MFSSTLMHWDYALILVFLGVVVPLLGRRRVQYLLQLPLILRADRLALYASTIAFQWATTALILWRLSVHHIHAEQLGLAISKLLLTITLTIVLSALILANQIFSLRRIVSRPSDMHGFMPQLALKVFPQDDIERLAFLALVSTVAACEELIYRGFIQRVFEDWSGGSALIGIVAAAIFFALAHLYQGRRGLVSTFTMGVVFSCIRAWTDSLLPSFAAHFVADITIGLLAPGRIRKAMSDETSGVSDDPQQLAM